MARWLCLAFSACFLFERRYTSIFIAEAAVTKFVNEFYVIGSRNLQQSVVRLIGKSLSAEL